MEKNRAIAAFSALGQSTRLDAFRTLVEAGPAGLSVGQVAQALGLRQNTTSVALGVLAQAGLVTNRRVGRESLYAADLATVDTLADFLKTDCCGGRPELCPPGPGAELETFAMTRPKNVLFLCTGNSARSLMAEAILNRAGRGKFNAYSAGSNPKTGPHPYTLDLLKRVNHDISGIRSKDWAEFAVPEAPEMDFVFTVCDKAAAEVCPVWPGQPMTAHWGVPDPVAAQGNEAEKRLAFSEAYRMLNNRISIFASLPMESLDRLSLQKKLDEIGQDEVDAARV